MIKCYITALECGANMQYSSKMTGCPATCSDTDAPNNCVISDTEGCECMPGFVLNDKSKCIVKEYCCEYALNRRVLKTTERDKKLWYSSDEPAGSPRAELAPVAV